MTRLNRVPLKQHHRVQSWFGCKCPGNIMCRERAVGQGFESIQAHHKNQLKTNDSHGVCSCAGCGFAKGSAPNPLLRI